MYIHPNSACLVFATPRCVIFHEVVHTNKAFMRHVTPVEQKWVTKLLPRTYDINVARLCGRTATAGEGTAGGGVCVWAGLLLGDAASV